MITLGIDIGSATSKCVILREGKDILASAVVPGGIGTDGAEKVKKAALSESGLRAEDIRYSVVTGYGRSIYTQADEQVSELSCHALGAHAVFPQVRTIIDIGGQDVKVISLDTAGRMKNFLMNDKCAAGTGRFLERMAAALQIGVEQLEQYAAQAEKPASISNTCTVFAESEVISQLANGVSRADLVAGVRLCGKKGFLSGPAAGDCSCSVHERRRCPKCRRPTGSGTTDRRTHPGIGQSAGLWRFGRGSACVQKAHEIIINLYIQEVKNHGRRNENGRDQNPPSATGPEFRKV